VGTALAAFGGGDGGSGSRRLGELIAVGVAMGLPCGVLLGHSEEDDAEDDGFHAVPNHAIQTIRGNTRHSAHARIRQELSLKCEWLDRRKAVVDRRLGEAFQYSSSPPP
jgi:hypothetical protein